VCAGKRGATITSIFSDSPSSFSRYKKVGFLQGFTGGRDRRGCVLGMEHLLIVGSKKVGFLQGFTGGSGRKACVLSMSA